MNFYSCLDIPRAEARIHEKKSNYLKAILENHQNRSTINRKRAADLPYFYFYFYERLLNKYEASFKNALNCVVSVPTNIANTALSLRNF